MANRFAVLGANTSSTATWAATSGGAGGQSVPTAADDVLLDANTPGDVTIDATLPCRSIDGTGFTHALIRNATLNVGTSTAPPGNVALKFSATMTTSGAGLIQFINTNSGANLSVTWAGKQVAAVTFQTTGVTATYTIADAMDCGAGTVTVNRGVLDLTGRTLACGTFQTTAALARTITLTNATLTCTGWTVSGSGFTLNLGGSTINMGSGTFAGGGQANYNVVNFTGATTTKTVTGANTIATVSVAGIVLIPASTTSTWGTVTSAGAKGAYAAIRSATAGTATTLNVTGGATVLANLSITDVAVTGGPVTIQDGNVIGTSSGVTATRTLQPAASGAGR